MTIHIREMARSSQPERRRSTGGIKHPEYQVSVARAMKEDLNKDKNERPNFFYHLGDVIYYNGESNKYYDQFYEPYDHFVR
jgi:hypothetical protein